MFRNLKKKPNSTVKSLTLNLEEEGRDQDLQEEESPPTNPLLRVVVGEEEILIDLLLKELTNLNRVQTSTNTQQEEEIVGRPPGQEVHLLQETVDLTNDHEVHTRRT